MKTFTKTLLALLLALLMLVSCGPAATGDSNTTPPAIDTPAETTAAPQPVVINHTLISDTVSYTVLRAEECDSDIVEEAKRLRDSLDELTDHTVKISTDWQKRGTEPDPEALEILLSNTNRPESDQVSATLGYHDYAIRLVGKKVVIAAGNGEALATAIDYFLSDLISVDAATGNITLIGEYTYNHPTPDVISSYEELSEYTLVFPASDPISRDAAHIINDAIVEAGGTKLKLATDTTAPTAKEILIGKTNREQSAALDNAEGLSYVINIKDGKIAMGGNVAVANTHAAEKFVNEFLKGKYYDGIKVPADLTINHKRVIELKGGEDPALAEGADLRIMSFNILAELWDEKAVLEGRDTLVPTIILAYMPDVVGLQEVTAKWYKILEPALDGVYKFASYTIPDGRTNYSTIMYNVGTTELIECKTTVFKVGNSALMRNLTWARFRRIADGEEYIVSCTHWDITEEKREAQYPENAQLINQLYEKYKCPIFATGDYNSNEQALFGKFLKDTGMIDPKYKAKVINNAGKTTHTLFQPRSNSELCIDHIAVTPGPELLYYNVLICNDAINASDHCPIYIDVKLK